VTALGNRVRVGLLAGQPLVAEVTGKAVEELGLQVGQEVTAGFKATATRVVGL
jgi:molybdopterin-binding protein